LEKKLQTTSTVLIKNVNKNKEETKKISNVLDRTEINHDINNGSSQVTKIEN
jgi:hypothetical protein